MAADFIHLPKSSGRLSLELILLSVGRPVITILAFPRRTLGLNISLFSHGDVCSLFFFFRYDPGSYQIDLVIICQFDLVYSN